MLNKILIRTSDRKTLHKDRRTLGMNGENLQEVLLFCLDEKIEGTGIVEVELPNGEKGMIQVECTEEGYELPVKSSLLSQTGFVKFQLRILHDNEEIFKSEIIPLEVKDSINATATIPEEYPSWVDTLTNLKKDLEKAESERVSNENERISAEKTRQENFTKMQKKSEEAVSNIKDLTDKYNENDKQKTEAFNKNFEEKQKAINDNAEAKTTAFGENAEAQTKTFNTNSDDKLAEYNKNHTAKMKEYDDNYDTKTKTFDDNAAAKLDEYNKNDKTKTDAYNKNTELKEKSFNDNAETKTKTFNSNAADKQNEFDENASDKLAEYNQNAKELINKVEQVQAENEALKAENKLIKEQIPSASVSGNSVHIEDSSNLDFDWKINGNQHQATREGYNLIDIQNNNRIFMNLASDMKHENYENGILFNYDYDSDYAYHNAYRFAFIYYPFKKNKQYRLSWKTQNLGEIPQSLQYYFPEFEQYLTLNNAFTPQNDTNWIAIFVKNDDFVEGCKVAITDVMLTEGSEIKPYEQYGVSPSPDYPSEIETVKDNVEIDVVNKNLLDMSNAVGGNDKGITCIVNEDGSYSYEGTATDGTINVWFLGYWAREDILFSLKPGSYYINGIILYSGKDALNQNNEIVTFKETQNITGVRAISAVAGKTYNEIIYPIIALSDKAVEWVSHQSQTAIMPIQQEMLEGDYIADVEHHEWGKIVLDGVNYGCFFMFPNGRFDISNPTTGEIIPRDCKNIEDWAVAEPQNICCTHLPTVSIADQMQRNMPGITNGITGEIAIKLDNATEETNTWTVETINAYLKQQYEAGTPVIIYYKLAEPLDLELTEEQKAIRDTKLYTYKNITNIDVSDELASIDVNYKKDPTTEHDELQNQIDEIKQLISTTETSALLLDNLQKDVETEVE